MKLKLRTSGDVQIITVSDLESSRNVEILKAGITKIFKTGKNRIVLELNQAKSISTELLRELGRLKLLANELSGDIVLAELDAETKLKVNHFSKPPFALTFEKTEQALQHFKDSTQKKAVPAASPAIAPAAAATEASNAQSSKHRPDSDATKYPEHRPDGDATKYPEHRPEGDATKYKEQILQRETGELGALRKENARLKAENHSLMALVATKILDRRHPPDEAAYREQIQILESQLAEILEKPPEKKT